MVHSKWMASCLNIIWFEHIIYLIRPRFENDCTITEEKDRKEMWNIFVNSLHHYLKERYYMIYTHGFPNHEHKNLKRNISSSCSCVWLSSGVIFIMANVSRGKTILKKSSSTRMCRLQKGGSPTKEYGRHKYISQRKLFKNIFFLYIFNEFLNENM